MVQLSVTELETREVSQKDSILSCGFSPLGLILTVVVGVVFAVGAILLGRLKYDDCMPLAGSCSVAISAACHALEYDKANGYMMPVTWGVVEVKGGIGRCAVTTAADIESPKEGIRYQ